MTAREIFEAWLVEERKALRIAGITTTKLEWDMWQAFQMGWKQAELEIGRQELKRMQKESQQ